MFQDAFSIKKGLRDNKSIQFLLSIALQTLTSASPTVLLGMPHLDRGPAQWHGQIPTTTFTNDYLTSWTTFDGAGNGLNPEHPFSQRISNLHPCADDSVDRRTLDDRFFPFDRVLFGGH